MAAADDLLRSPVVAQEAISVAEAKFEIWRRRVGMAACLPAAILVWLSGADSPAQRENWRRP